VDLLDGLNRYRFAGNADLRAAWERAERGFGTARPNVSPKAKR
jgi:hypothetical protein